MNKANSANDSTSSTATLGGGCFWCVEAVFQRLPGVSSVVSGYAGGATRNPTYESVCGGRTGHAEVIQITFDPAVISFAELLEVFWLVHDPTTLNRQGADVGTQYRSIVLHHDDAQRETAEASRAALEAAIGRPVVTEIAPLTDFYPAEDYHQEFYQRNPAQPYCQATIPPKLKKLQAYLEARAKKGGGA